MKRSKRGLFAIIALILVTGGALAYGTSLPGLSAATAASGKTAGPAGNGDGLVTLAARLSQTKVLQGSDGNVAVSLQLSAAELDQGNVRPDVPVDLVVVIDRSGSMDGDKINDARSAIIKLIGRLTTKDRLALISYSNDVRTDVGLIPVNGANRNLLIDAVNGLQAAGGTNLGGGLQRGIDLLSDRAAVGRQRKLILISDGLANQGITDPDALARMASTAVEDQFTVSSVGVGYDFNEMLMTSLADHGAGRYYFLENPQAFAKVFEAEFQTARQVAAAGIQLRIPLQNGVRLIHAGGYPISEQGNEAVFYPGDLLSGQQRTLFLTFAVPTNQIGETAINRILVGYTHQGASTILAADVGLTVACVKDPSQVTASVDKTTWTRKVLQEDYGRLKSSVAEALRKGEREAAMEEIQAYEQQTRQVNASVQSPEVQKNIDEDIQQLRDDVADTFAGAPAQVEAKRKQQAKVLQYDSYKARRAKQ